MTEFAEDVLGDSTLRSPPEVVARGLASRLVRGDTESATNYLAFQTNKTPAEAQAKITQIQQKITTAATDAGIAAARTMKMIGWTMFLSILIGTIASMLTGAMGGNVVNRTRTTNTDYRPSNTTNRPSATV
ncbi:MAG: hypothetical protein EOP09_16995 [Proteobacteria bacterium]|nr:MAG: hypothetical protein EOP09_16995 [Pseudomonadota bacterium]